MNYPMTKLAAVIIFFALLAGCKVSDPGSPYANRPPTTTITSAPQTGSTVNHFVSIFWSGNDGDGQIAGFNMTIDDTIVAFTTRTDSSISFSSPATGEPVLHKFKIQAVDNDGAADPAPPEIQFRTSNTGPTCEFTSDNTVRPGSNVGGGFRLKLRALDANRSGIWFAVSIDDTLSWSEWSKDSVFMFAKADLGDFPAGATVISNDALTDGPHTIYARCRDSGLVESPIISRSVNVDRSRHPVMATIPSRYNHGIASDSLYPDGSIFHAVNAEMIMSIEANAIPYRGVLHSFRYRVTDAEWQPWQLEPDLAIRDLPVGVYSYQFQARDIAGALSDTSTFEFELLTYSPTDSILVVDETRDFNGAPSQPTDGRVDSFYTAMVEGYDFRNLDMATRINDTTTGAYLSPRDLEHIGLIIWHDDDWNAHYIDNHRRILGEYMQRGGRVIFSGWDIMRSFTEEPERSYSGSVFEYKYMRAFSAHRDPANNNLIQEGNGFIGENGFPTVHVDPTKILGSWHGSLPRLWTFDPRTESRVIGRLTTTTPGYFLENEVVGYYYDLSFRVAVFGLPLFYLNQSDAEAMFDVLLPRMLEGL